MLRRVIKFSCLEPYTGLSTPTNYAKSQNGLFVKPVKLGKRASGVPLHEVETIMAARVAGLPEEDIRALVRDLHEARKTGEQVDFGDWFARRKGEESPHRRAIPEAGQSTKALKGHTVAFKSGAGRRPTPAEFIAKKRAAASRNNK